MFPKFEDWCERVLHPEDVFPWNFRAPEFYEEYRVKYVIAKMITPRSILEVGVRFGYSAFSFLRASPCAIYYGIDYDEPSWGPCTETPRLWAEQNLKKHFLKALIQTFKLDTQKEKFVSVFFKSFDLVHIDADHSYLGSLNDMEKFWPVCSHVMVIDDYMEVRLSVDEFVRRHKDELVQFHVDSLRSSALLVRVQ